jgi:hypothetical protein
MYLNSSWNKLQRPQVTTLRRNKATHLESYDLEAGLQPLPRLIDLLPKLRTVVFMSVEVQKAGPQVEALSPISPRTRTRIRAHAA